MNNTQSERRIYLIHQLLSEQLQYAELHIPSSKLEQKNLLRSLFNIRQPKPVSKDFLSVQDAYLQTETERKGITDIAADLTPCQDNIYL